MINYTLNKLNYIINVNFIQNIELVNLRIDTYR